MDTLLCTYLMTNIRNCIVLCSKADPISDPRMFYVILKCLSICRHTSCLSATTNCILAKIIQIIISIKNNHIKNTISDILQLENNVPIQVWNCDVNTLWLKKFWFWQQQAQPADAPAFGLKGSRRSSKIWISTRFIYVGIKCTISPFGYRSLIIYRFN